jgi:repressor LexA
MTVINEKQVRMLAFIKDFMTENGYPPTHEEIRTGLKISSKSLVSYHLEALEHAKLLSRAPNTPRGIQLGMNELNSAAPWAAEMQSLDVLELTFDGISNGHNLFAIKVEEPLADDGFAGNGDIIIIQRQRGAENGDLVALQLTQERQTDFKRYFRENGHVRLQSPVDAEANIFARPTDVEIQGKVIAVIRQLGF